MKKFNNVAIIGVGLIGGSFALALKAAEQLPGVEHVALIDSAPGTRDDRRGPRARR